MTTKGIGCRDRERERERRMGVTLKTRSVFERCILVQEKEGTILFSFFFNLVFNLKCSIILKCNILIKIIDL